MAWDLTYKLLDATNGAERTGKTINVSAHGVLITAAEELVTGQRIELSISWPAPPDGQSPRRLVIRGRVVRCASGTAAIEIGHYD